MRITIVGLNYAPDVTGVAPYTTGLARGLQERGHRVEVITGVPHYPQWRPLPGYHGDRLREVIDGVDVRRVRHHIPARHGAVDRLRLELGFGRAAVTRRWARPDLVLTVSPALLATCAVVARARAQRIPVGVVVHDVYSRGVVETGAAAGAAGGFARLERGMIEAATGTVVIHDGFVETFAGLGAPRERMTVIRNWSHVVAPARVDRAAVRARYGWGADEVVVLHTGNMGRKQGLENVVDAARVADRRSLPVRIVLVGDGNQRARLEESAAGVARLQFLPLLPADEYMSALGSADVLLVNERPGVAEMAVPSKLTSYFASGRPVLAATGEDSVTAREVRESGAGLVVGGGDPEALIDGALRLSAMPGAFGVSGQRFAADRLDEERALDSYERWCHGLVGAGVGATVGGSGHGVG